MFDLRDRSTDPRFGVNAPCSGGYHTEPAKRFRFAVTWTSLTSHLDLRQAVARTSTTAAIAFPPIERPEPRFESDARWEMVVPKMVRTDRGPKALPPAPITNNRNGDIYPPISIPEVLSLESARPRLLSRAFAAIERCTRSILAGPAKPIDAIPLWSRLHSPHLAVANGRSRSLQVLQLSAPSSPIASENQSAKPRDTQDRHAVRELLLSKITDALRSHSGNVDRRVAMDHRQERWLKAPRARTPL
jgi:hypothetical protein